MLEGLEAAEVKLSECFENKDFRTDSSFYTATLFVNPNLEYRPIGKCLHSSQYGISISMNEDGKGFPIYRMNEIHNLLCDLDVNKFADISLGELSTFVLRDRDVLFNRTNSFEWVGRTGIYYKNDDVNRVFASYLVRLIPDISIILPEYLTTFLNTKFGMADIKRRARQSINQTNVNPEEVKEIRIPILDMELQQDVAIRLQNANQKRIVAQSLYSSAESYLLECLGMQDFVANPDAYNIKTLKESFLESGRIDAEYYLPKYEDLTLFVQNYSLGSLPLSDIVDFYRGSLISDTYYIDYDVARPAYIRGGDISSNRMVADNMVSISSDFIPSEETICIEGDIVMAMIGSVGTASIVTQDFSGSYISNNLGLLRIRNHSIRAEVLHLYLTSPIGRMFFTQRQMVTAQPKIAFKDIENIPIPLIRPEVQAEIAQHIQRSFALRKEASQLLEEAKLSVEQAIAIGGGKSLIYNGLQEEACKKERLAMYLLLKELGLIDDMPQRNKVVTTEKKLSATFFVSGRLDAEYYQPKYDYLDSQLAQLPTQRLGELVEVRKSIEPGSEAYQTEGIPFVRVSDLNKFGLETPSVCLDRTTYATAPRPQKDTILLSKDGSVGIAYKLDTDTDMITSGAILHLSVKEKEVLPDYLTLVLNSPIVKMQAERDAGGSIIQHWKPSEIEQVIIPILPPDIQQKLSEQVSKSFELRREAEALLAEAKAMVERAIEATA